MWKYPSITKMYEALGAVADDRVQVDGNAGKCFSSSGNKFYEITHSSELSAIMSNDNTSYWKGELGYPAVAFLLKAGVLEYRAEQGQLLKGIPWKNINQKYKNDFEKALEHILQDIDPDKRDSLREYCSLLVEEIKKLELKKLGKQTKPPEGY